MVYQRRPNIGAISALIYYLVRVAVGVHETAPEPFFPAPLSHTHTRHVAIIHSPRAYISIAHNIEHEHARGISITTSLPGTHRFAVARACTATHIPLNNPKIMSAECVRVRDTRYINI